MKKASLAPTDMTQSHVLQNIEEIGLRQNQADLYSTKAED
jgi:hypothetical protein